MFGLVPPGSLLSLNIKHEKNRMRIIEILSRVAFITNPQKPYQPVQLTGVRFGGYT
jgi:hypothetical protein